jgi:hypothetical protein
VGSEGRREEAKHQALRDGASEGKQVVDKQAKPLGRAQALGYELTHWNRKKHVVVVFAAGCGGGGGWVLRLLLLAAAAIVKSLKGV